MIGTSMCWHKSPWIIQIHNTPLSQTKRTCPSQYYQTSCEPSFSEGRGMDSIAFSRLSVSVACSTRIYRRKILTQRSYCRHRSTGSLYPKHNVLASPFERRVTNQASCRPKAPTKGKMEQPQTNGLQFQSTVMQHEPNTISNIVSARHANIIISRVFIWQEDTFF